MKKETKVISIINLKGGVFKTTTTLSLGYILSHDYGKKVLMIDNDKQGNLSKSLKVYDPDDPATIASIMDMKYSGTLIKKTDYEGIRVITANMNLLTANTRAILDITSKQQDRLKKALEYLHVYDVFDYVLIDNAPDINISIINALAVSHDVIIPMHMDEYSLDGMEILRDQICSVQENFNPDLKNVICLATDFMRDDVHIQAVEHVRSAGYRMFNQAIRHTNAKPAEATWAKMPLPEYSSRCGASQDCKKWVREYLGGELS